MRNFTAFLLVVFLCFIGFSQGDETFDNFDYGGSSYQDGSFEGQDGSTWEYVQSRGDTDINGSALMLGRNRTPDAELTSGTISGGIGTLQFSYMQAFTNDVEMEVYVNGDLVYTATTDNEQNDIITTEEIEVNVDGDFTLKFSNPDGAQVVIDDIIWTAYSGDSDGDCAATVPFTESFENHDDSDNDTFLSGCWTQEQLQGANWILNNSITYVNRGPPIGECDSYLADGTETWIFHPIQLEENIDYTLSFYAVESNTLGAEVTASYGTTGDSEAMTNEIIT